MSAPTTIPIDRIVVPAGRRPLTNVPRLAGSIAEIGLLHPITLAPDYRLVAGYHRLEACRSLGWTEIPATISDADPLDLELAEIDENLIRNDLSVMEQGEHIARRDTLLAEKDQRRTAGRHAQPSNGVTVIPLKTTADLAGEIGMSTSSLQQRKQIATKIPEAVRDVIRDLPVANHTRDLLELARATPAEQMTLAAVLASGTVETVKDAKHALREGARAADRTARAGDVALLAPDDRCRLLHGDLLVAGAAIADESIDVIITDPPYPREFLHLYSDLAQLAARVLKPGGSCLVLAGQSYLPDVLARLAAHLTYHWTCAYLTPGGQAVQLWQRKVNTFWKPLLWLTKGAYAGEWVGDVAASKVNDNDKRFHDWGQSESGMCAVVERFSTAGDLVLDPFLGGGTTALVALARDRRFVGIDVDAAALATTRERVGRLWREVAS